MITKFKIIFPLNITYNILIVINILYLFLYFNLSTYIIENICKNDNINTYKYKYI